MPRTVATHDKNRDALAALVKRPAAERRETAASRFESPPAISEVRD